MNFAQLPEPLCHCSHLSVRGLILARIAVDTEEIWMLTTAAMGLMGIVAAGVWMLTGQ